MILLAACPIVLFGQQAETYDIKSEKRGDCDEYRTVYRKLPADVRYNVKLEDGIIYFMFPHEELFESIFDKSSDGIAVDIVTRDQYTCGSEHDFVNSPIHRGFLMPPMYKKDLLKNRVEDDNGNVIIIYGKLPSRFNPLEVECNLLVLQKKALCGYHSFTNLDYSNWGLLETGLYRDSLQQTNQERLYKEVSKSLQFTIPFEKDQAIFNQDDIQPFYDTLELTDYNIEEIEIRAYTSVEGTLERNIELQEARAASIVRALQSVQQQEIISSVVARENWVEFYEDIQNTKFENLRNQSKEEVKLALRNDELLEQIEPVLSKHRKALITVELQKKFSVEETDGEQLKAAFQIRIKNREIDEALYLQRIIHEQIRSEKLPDEFLDRLEIPAELEYGPLLNNRAVFRSEQYEDYIYRHILVFEKLRSLLPENIKVQYNLTSLKLKAWTEGERITDRNVLKQEIEALSRQGLPPMLVSRLWVNYYIILTQYQYQSRNYKGRNSSLKEVMYHYKNTALSDDDLLSLAKYLAVNSKFNWAIDVLDDRAKAIDADEDLVFYYLRLTILRNNADNNEYRTFMLNAIDKNPDRFCAIFNSVQAGGYTFQLLEYDHLKSTYCENCQ